jgi:hypothetical protein
MCWPATTLPTTLISVDGYRRRPVASEESATGSSAPRNSAQESVAAGIWRMVLQGMAMVMPSTTAVPPHCDRGRPGQRAPLSAASWMKPVASNPCMSVATAEKTGGGTGGGAGTTNDGSGGTLGGLAVPPLA